VHLVRVFRETEFQKFQDGRDGPLKERNPRRKLGCDMACLILGCEMLSHACIPHTKTYHQETEKEGVLCEQY